MTNQSETTKDDATTRSAGVDALTKEVKDGIDTGGSVGTGKGSNESDVCKHGRATDSG